MANNPQMNIKIVGDENVAVLNKTVSWTPKDKIESTIVVNSSDGQKTVTFTNIDRVKTIVFSGNGNYIVSVTASANTISFETSDVFIFSPTPVFRSTITSMAISTTSTSDVTIESRIYGEQV